MKQFSTKLKALVVLGLFLFSSFGFKAQAQMEIPNDPNVRIGKLSNGLTYYIRHNKHPENRADFYIAQKVGSIQENPDQSGLAHFLEHMCFNGTTHYPGDSLKKYLESIGVKFGENLNAYTSIDETVYNISNVPVIREGVIDSCLLILHDWSNDLLLEDKEIDKERGVITEEWRTRMNASQRFIEKFLPIAFEGTKYANCLPIGDMKIVNGFEYQTLRDYYEKWYRPDLQGLIIVGDIDVDQVENKIKEMFKDIPAQFDGAERVYYPVPDNEETISYVYTDKEQQNVVFSIYNKYEPFPTQLKNNVSYLQVQFAISMITDMLNNRLNELSEQANPPFIYSGVYDSDFIVAKTKRAFTGVVACKENNIVGGIKSLLTELERAHKFGFTASEFERAKADYLSKLESIYNERDKTKNASYVNEYVRNFLDNEPAPGIEYEYNIINALAEHIKVEHINQLIPNLLQEKNKVITLFAPEKDSLKLPTAVELSELVNQVADSDITPYEDKVSNEPLISQELKGGKIISKKENSIYGTTEYTLSNGAKVIIKPTDFKADQIMLRAVSKGGTSLYDDSEIYNLNYLNDVASIGGIGNFSTTELNKALAGKMASVSASVSGLTESVSGYSTPKDFETLMQLTYLTFTAPRKDLDSYQSYITRKKAMLENRNSNPFTALQDTLTTALYNNHPRVTIPAASDLDKIDYDRILEIYKERFANAADFTFMFVGNIDEKKDLPLIEKYIGSLPASGEKENFIDRKMYTRKGNYKNSFIKEQPNPKATNLIIISGKMKYTERNDMLLDILAEVLTMEYTEKVREEEGGTYGVSVSPNLSKNPKEEAILQIFFDTDPNKRDMLMTIIYNELQQMIKEGPNADFLKKVKENKLKKLSELRKENSYWMSAIAEYELNKIDMIKDQENLINSITGKDIQKIMKELYNQKNIFEVSMISPAK